MGAGALKETRASPVSEPGGIDHNRASAVSEPVNAGSVMDRLEGTITLVGNAVEEQSLGDVNVPAMEASFTFAHV